jgi:hypothetical protein
VERAGEETGKGRGWDRIGGGGVRRGEDRQKQKGLERDCHKWRGVVCIYIICLGHLTIAVAALTRRTSPAD